VLLLVLAVLFAVMIALAVSDAGQVYLHWLAGAWRASFTWVKGLFS
jgi:uncharacterized membrane-anchored protein